MTYLQYHLVFILPLLLALGLVTWRETRRTSLAGSLRPERGWAARTALLFPLIPLLYTTPWDNYLVARGIWNYPPERVLGRLGYVPVEEYAFFLLQTVITTLWLCVLLRRGGPEGSGPAVSRRPLLTRWGAGLLWLGVAFAGALLLRQEHTLYLGLILAWAAPVLALLSFGFGDLVLGRPGTFWLAVLPPTLYLWATDLFAIRAGIWSISPRFTLGWSLGGALPAEEMVFFFITNLLIVAGVLSFLHPESLLRVRRLGAVARPWMGFTALYLLLKVPVPLWPAGFPLLGTLSTVCLFLAGLAFAWERLGAGRALGVAALAFSLGLGAEVLGSRTGLPFGAYSYRGAPGPLLLGVPLIVPLGWFAMTLSASLLARGRAWLTGLLLVGWDLGLEPLMTAQGYWSWGAGLRGVPSEAWARPADPLALWAGAPLQNFVAWFLIGAGLAWAFRRLGPGLYAPQGSGALPSSFAVAYLLEGLFLPAGLLLFGQPGAALLTLIAMGGLGAWALRRERSGLALPGRA